MLTRAASVSQSQREGIGIAWVAVSLGIFLLILAWATLSHRAFFTSDTGLRLIQVRALIQQQWRDFGLPYPAREVDPNFENVPYYYAHHTVNDKLFLDISPLFPLLSSFLYAVGGNLTLPIIPVAGGVLTALALYKLGHLAGFDRPQLLLPLSIFATPLLFYSLEFWDHTFVAAFSLWAAYLLARGVSAGGWNYVFAAGILAGVSLAERAEYAVFVAALGLGLLIVTRLRPTLAIAFAGGNLLSVLALSLLQYIWIGHPLGITYATYLLGYGVPDSYPFAPSTDIAVPTSRMLTLSRPLTYIEGRDPVTFSATLLCLLGLALVVFALRVPRWRRRSLLLVGAGLSVAGYLLWLVTVAEVAVTGLIPMAALLPLSLALVEGEGDSTGQRTYHFVLAATFAFIGVMLLIWPAYGGHHWATRYMLPTYPLLVYLAFYAFEHYRDAIPELRSILEMSFAGLLVLAVLIQFGGVRLLFQKLADEARVQAHIRALPVDVIVTNSPFLASQMNTLDKVFLYVQEPEDFDTLVPRMWQHDVREFSVVTLTAVPLTVPERSGEIVVREVQPLLYQLERASDSGEELGN